MVPKLEHPRKRITKELLPKPKIESHHLEREMRTDSQRRVFLIIFGLASLWVHLILALVLILISLGSKPRTLIPTHPTQVTFLSQDPEHPYVPTDKQSDARPHPATIESDNDTDQKSENSARNHQEAMPDVQGRKDLHAQFENRPLAMNPPAPEGKPAPNPQPEDQPQQQSTPQPAAKSQQKPDPQKPQKIPAPKPDNDQDQTTPDGLPVLPPISAPTLSEVSPSPDQPRPVMHQSGEPPASFEAAKSDIEGSADQIGQTSVDAMQTEVGRYKARVYRSVGSRWYSKLQDGLTVQTIPVGTVHIRFTIHDDGSVDWEVLGGDTPDLQLLRAISENAIREGAPYPPFSEKLKQEIGDHYTDDFSFSVY